MKTACQQSATHPHTETRAIVLDVAGSDAIVEIEPAGCGRCHEPGGCGGQSLTRLFAGHARHYRVRNTCAAQPGDQVSLQIARTTLHQTANRAYVMPLLALIVFALLGNVLAGDSGAMTGAGTGLLLGWYGLRHWARQAPHAQADAGNLSRHPHLAAGEAIPHPEAASTGTAQAIPIQMTRITGRR